MTPPLVSVIIPNYNHAPYLDERIRSIVEQSFQDFEIILLDDCSTDQSISILNKWAKHPKISHFIVNKQNSGSTFLQWEKGFSLAKGKYIWIAESDDVAHPDFLNITVNYLNQFPDASLCFTGSFLIDASGNIDSRNWDRWTKSEATKNFSYIENKHFITHQLLWFNAIYNASAVLFRRSALSEIDNTYKQLHYCGDWYFWSELIRKGHVIIVYNKLNYFRQHNIKVSPKAEANGLQFKEGFIVIEHISKSFHLSAFIQNAAKGALYRKIKKYNKFSTPDIKNKLLEEFNQRYKTRPIFLRICYRIQKLISKHK
ncbi:glycosyltransferase family 2 protein [Coprobacter secundus]|uniref:glycosyltransferase family 2 protein n=1 Tax=Coprobacter secundus TaxID=1501392 RepID=UPI0022DEBF7D|nr:glycosyltransferase [Coprobacter secundus]